MELIYRLNGLDCPNCSAKIEREVNGLDTVSAASVNLMQQTLTLQTDVQDVPSLKREIEKIVRKHEPDVTVEDGSTEHAHKHEHNHAHEHGHCRDCAHEHGHGHSHDSSENRIMLFRILAGAVLFAAGMLLSFGKGNLCETASDVLMLVTYALLGWDVVLHAIRNILRGKVFDEHFLMSVSTVGAIALRDFPEAAAVMLLYQTGELFQSMAVQRSRKSVSALLEICPDTANLIDNGEIRTVPCENVSVTDEILVKPGERIPLDGIVVSGESFLDTAALTGESLPRSVKPGDPALSGCINQSGTLRLEVTKPFSESTASRIVRMVEHASSRKAPAENFITTFARYYTPVVVIAALLLALIPPLAFSAAWSIWIRRAFVFLIVSCPCALVISIPLTYFGGIGAASRQGVLIKGSNYLEALNRVTEIVFDKTGTLTEGVFHVKELLPAEGFTEADLLALAAACEQGSNHPIAQSVMQAFGGQTPAFCEDLDELPGYGIKAVSDGNELLCGNAKLMEQNGIPMTVCEKAGTKIYAAKNGKFAGCILIADACKKDSKETIRLLRKNGIRKMTMLTGDDRTIAESVASELSLDGFRAELLPDQKLSELEQMLRKIPSGEKLAFVGDGINDAPVLARADLGIAMGALGADAAIEAADVVLMTDEPSGLLAALKTAAKTRRIVTENLIFALSVKLLLLVLGAIGAAEMWAAVFGDVGVAILAVLNAMRMLRTRTIPEQHN
ncbi:MAG: cadmium-translocating P-type ATPase [Oscillospiraceae bacterium]|nr:cadmium-translocating P-type ATPase [Oscillospiraceae bacterium]